MSKYVIGVFVFAQKIIVAVVFFHFVTKYW
jgi:hypothetical protein